jgi:hypothetical protein
VALFGAAGKIGTVVSERLRRDAEHRLDVVEVGAGVVRLRERGFSPVSQAEAVRDADVVVLAVPDKLLADIAAEVVPRMNRGAMLVCLDPAVPYAGKLPERADIAYFTTHPGHPPLFGEETSLEALRDHFGGTARQSIVNALVQGSEEDYARGEALARKMWAPVLRSHRVTIEQMAMLEPGLVETVALTCLAVVREAMDEVTRRGVPREAARDFLLGHINVELAILFGAIEWRVSEGAKVVLEESKALLFRSDWKRVFERDVLAETVGKIVGDVPLSPERQRGPMGC